ncbi:hypothetical protein BKA70DRAFT_1491425 [Coprinopsis sp. MPI-PUGE-AT-0042]|nr:hypothetical protein BKA70DRAFT_1491425 [Coprinopsis sp. MPI-PUGE-AT-0042]
MSLCLCGACLLLHSLSWFSQPSPRQDKHNRYIRLMRLNLLPSTAFVVTWVIESGVPLMDSIDYTIVYASLETGKWSASAGICSTMVELMGGALMVWRATAALERNRYLRQIPGVTYAFFLGICIASLARQIQTIGLIGRAVSNIQGPWPGSCTTAPAPNMTCKTFAEHWFSIQEPMAAFDVSEYREEALRICDKELQHPSPIQPGSLESVGERRHLLDDDDFLPNCGSPSRKELSSLQYAFGARVIEPLQTTYRWWRRTQSLGSFSLSLSSISVPGPVDSLEYETWLYTNNVKHVMHVLWIHAQVLGPQLLLFRMLSGPRCVTCG